jgi:hypothetical protein
LENNYRDPLMETQNEIRFSRQNNQHVYTEFTEERRINPLMTNAEQMVQTSGSDAVLIEVQGGLL